MTIKRNSISKYTDRIQYTENVRFITKPKPTT